MRMHEMKVCEFPALELKVPAQDLMPGDLTHSGKVLSVTRVKAGRLDRVEVLFDNGRTAHVSPSATFHIEGSR